MDQFLKQLESEFTAELSQQLNNISTLPEAQSEQINHLDELISILESQIRASTNLSVPELNINIPAELVAKNAYLDDSTALPDQIFSDKETLALVCAPGSMQSDFIDQQFEFSPNFHQTVKINGECVEFQDGLRFRLFSCGHLNDHKQALCAICKQGGYTSYVVKGKKWVKE
ncbi:Hypothetical_protein [Hexamita inflata]|uniref:Hypothetical_protein n=1 Tax=Hexamita inflata TaxID=28002 RepID=A0AA86TP73_9EUKA|nr:Hypothetical protein HINF_LOCUS12134 [Hexamita inflata]